LTEELQNFAKVFAIAKVFRPFILFYFTCETSLNITELLQQLIPYHQQNRHSAQCCQLRDVSLIDSSNADHTQ